MPGSGVVRPHGREVHVAVGEIGGLRQGGEQRFVLAADRGLQAAVGAAGGEKPADQRGRLPEPLGGAQRDVPGHVLGPEQLGKDPVAVI
jgi:hypothetical protein